MGLHNTNDGESSVLQLLQEINSGITDPKLLDKQNRQQCINVLVTEGYSYSQIAQILKRSEKTIGRDLKDIRARNELTPNVEFAKQLVGEMFQKAMNHHSYLMRLARMKDASISQKTQSEFAAWRVLKELIGKLQSLGYLPSQPAEIVGTFYHRSDDSENNSPEAMRKMLVNVEEAAKDAGLLDGEVVTKINVLEARIAQSEIAVEIKQLENKTLKVEEKYNEKRH